MTTGPFAWTLRNQDTKAPSVEAVYHDDILLLTGDGCQTLKGKGLCHPKEGKCGDAGVFPDNERTVALKWVGQQPLCREKEV